MNSASPGATHTDSWRWSRALLATVIVLFCLIPLFLVGVISLGEKVEGAAWRWGFDLSAYQRFFVGADWPQTTTTLYLKLLWYSFFYSLVAAIIAVATSFPFTWMVTRQSRRVQTAWLVFFLSSLSLSEVYVVMGWDILLSNRSGLPMLFKESGLTQWLKSNGLFDVLRDWGLANPRNVRFKPTGFATICTLVYLVWPYAVILLYPSLSRIDRSTVEAARTMGASPVTVIRTIVIPMMRIPLVGSILLLFVFLLGAYVTIAVFAPPDKQTLTISIVSAVRGITLNAPFGAAQAIILLLMASLVLISGRKLMARTESR